MKTALSTMKKRSTIQTGVAGEYFVAAELSRRGYVESLTLRNTRGIDVLASNADATKSVGIQVKTYQGTRPDWLLNVKAEEDTAENLFYVFVCLPVRGEPSFYVVPCGVVSKYVLRSVSAMKAGSAKSIQIAAGAMATASGRVCCARSAISNRRHAWPRIG
jgi:hypothetical protein